jgi:hypothetical protein
MDEQAQLAYLIQRMEDEGVEPPVVTHPPVVSSFDLAGIAAHIAAGAENIIIMAGAGISVSAGIPDFRSPGTGLYDNLQKYNLPEPEAIFEINYFKDNPRPFYMLADEVRCRVVVGGRGGVKSVGAGMGWGAWTAALCAVLGRVEWSRSWRGVWGWTAAGCRARPSSVPPARTIALLSVHASVFLHSRCNLLTLKHSEHLNQPFTIC